MIKKSGKKLGTINWQEPHHSEAPSSLPDFKKFCLSLYPKKNKSSLDDDVDCFSNATKKAADQHEKFCKEIATIPLISTIVFWIESVAQDKFHFTKNSNMMQQLITHGYIGLKDNSGHIWTLKHMVAIGHDSVVEAIRYNGHWTLDRAEEFVNFYIDFVNWLSSKTFGYVPLAIDADRMKTKQRKLPYDAFIAISKHLQDRERVIAKLLYYGGERTLEDILSLKIEGVHASDGKIKISEASIAYPKHVLKDLQAYIGDRKRGYVFVGRQGEKTDHTVPYRSLKTVVSQLNLDPSFTFKDFTSNR